jgi:hypothetical protein
MLMEILQNSSNLFVPYRELKKRFENLSNPECEGLNFDFSYLEAFPLPDIWYIYNIANPQKQAQVLSKIDKTPEGYNDQEVMLEF